METTENKLVKGVLLEDAVGFLKEKKGEAAVGVLEKATGPLIFDQHRMYPLADLSKLQTAVIKEVFGKDSDEAYKELGLFTFRAFTHTVVGATLTNVAHSPKELLEKIQELWDAVLNFGSRKLISIDEKKHSALVEIVDDPRVPAYLQGAIEGGFKSIGVRATTKVLDQGNSSYHIEISW